MPNYKRKRDSNERAIIKALEDAGALVLQESHIDLYVLPPSGGCFVAIEVKSPNGRLTPYQVKLHQKAKAYGYEIAIVTNIDEALRAIGISKSISPQSKQ